MAACLLLSAVTAVWATEPPGSGIWVPTSKITEKGGVRSMQYFDREGKPMGSPFMLHPGMTRPWGPGYGDLDAKVTSIMKDKKGGERKILVPFSLDRSPEGLFMAFQNDVYDWYNGAVPLRKDLMKWGDRHPLFSGKLLPPEGRDGLVTEYGALALWLKFDGTPEDSSRVKKQVSVVGEPEWVERPGVFGKGIRFSKPSQFVKIENPGVDCVPGDSFAMGFWFRAKARPATDSVIIRRGDGRSGSFVLEYVKASDALQLMLVSPRENMEPVTFSIPMDRCWDGAWHYLVLSHWTFREESAVEGWVDGVQKLDKPFEPAGFYFDCHGALSIGNGESGKSMEFEMDDFRFYRAGALGEALALAMQGEKGDFAPSGESAGKYEDLIKTDRLNPMKGGKTKQKMATARQYALFYDLAVAGKKITPGDEDYAYKAARILYQLALDYKYLPSLDGKLTVMDKHTGEAGKSDLWIGKAGPVLFGARPQHKERNWHYTRDIPVAYDLVYNSGAWKKLDAEFKDDCRKRVELDLLNHILWMYGEPPAQLRYDNQSRGGLTAMMWGMGLDDPLLYRAGLARFLDIFQTVYMADGIYYETTQGYTHFLTGALWDELKEMPKYDFPPNWKDPFTGEVGGSSEDVKKKLVQSIVQVGEGLRRTLMPDGRFFALNECGWFKGPLEWWSEVPGSIWFGATNFCPAESKSENLTWLGHSVLGRGKGTEQVQVHLHYGSHDSPHMHSDDMEIGLFANGQELFAENSYHSLHRNFDRSAESHNHVVMRGKGSTAVPVGEHAPFSGPDTSARQKYFTGTIMIPGRKIMGGGEGKGEAGYVQTLFEASEPVQITEAYHPFKTEGGGRYGTGTGKMHRRTLMTVPTQAGNVYVVDVVRTRGGVTNDWLVHGPGQHDYRIEVKGVDLKPVVASPFKADLLRQADKGLRAGEVRNVFTFDIITPELGYFKKPGDPDAETIRRGCSRTTFLPGPEMTLFTAMVGNGRADTSGEGDRKGLMDQVIVRQYGGDSTFIAVHETYELGKTKPMIDSVRQIPADGDTVALEIKLGGRTDYVFLGTSEGATCKAGGVEFRGRAGYASIKQGVPSILYLNQGGRLSAGGKTVAGRPSFTGKITKILRKKEGDDVNAFIGEGERPSGLELAGKWLTVELGDGMMHHFPILKAEAKSGQTIFITGDEEPGLALRRGRDKVMDKDVDYVEYLFFPRKLVLGGLNFKVADTLLYKAD
jgi:hypothetical protein